VPTNICVVCSGLARDHDRIKLGNMNTDIVHYPSKQVLNAARNMVNDFYTRDFDDELEARHFDDELEARDFDEDFEARDFDDELEARDFDRELEALSRRFNNDLEARGHHW
jgi:hypothetical protein